MRDHLRSLLLRLLLLAHLDLHLPRHYLHHNHRRRSHLHRHNCRLRRHLSCFHRCPGRLRNYFLWLLHHLLDCLPAQRPTQHPVELHPRLPGQHFPQLLVRKPPSFIVVF